MNKIFGIGTDVVNYNRFKNILRKNNLLKKRIFSKNEIIYCTKKKDKFASFAKRFAAKEAFSKALGTGIAKGLNFNEIEVKNDLQGKPEIIIKGKSLKVVNKTLNKKKFKIFISLSDDTPFIVATALITI
tara:strand:- start:104 stop:493 length:390 start_codon:yes stop_codon:yes gene_type:complete